MPQTPCFQLICPLPFPGQVQGPWPEPGNRKAPQNQNGSQGVRVGEGKDRRFGRQSSSSTVLKIDTGILKIGSLCLPEEMVLAGPLFAGEQEISRFSLGAAAPARAVRRGQGPASGELRARRSLHGRDTALGSQGISHGRMAGCHRPSSAALAAERDQSPREAGAAPGMGCGGEAEAGRVGPTPGKGTLQTRPGVIWRLRGIRCGEPGAAAPPAAAAPARPPSAGPPPPAAGSC